jgi:hypothetical protein
MNHPLLRLAPLFALLCSLLLPVGRPAQAAVLGSAIGGELTADTTLTQANRPYDATRINVRPGVTLTVEPGVEIRFADLGGLEIYGTLVAKGTAEEPILFTGATRQQGAWRGVWVEGSPTNIIKGSVLEHVTVEYGGLASGYGASLGVRYAEVSVRHSTFRGSARYGIYADTMGVPHVSDTLVADNAQEAILFLVADVNPVFARLRASGNGSDTISMLNGSLKGDHVWENAGLPYRLMPGNTIITVTAAGSLTIEPGVTVLMDSNARLYIYGRLVAEGTAERPITITGVVKEPGSWQGMTVEGSPTRPATASMRHVTVEYGGLNNSGGANIYVAYGQLMLSRSVVRHGIANGVWLHTGAQGSVIEQSQLVDNKLFALYNVDPRRVAVAPNNWWGAPNGPSDEDGCVGGTGARVSNGVVAWPFLDKPDAPAVSLPASSARLLTIKPRRLFATADGRMRVWVEITLRDGAGAPLPGREVSLRTSLGSAADGGVTDAEGRALAYVTAWTPGDALISAVLDDPANCEFARSAEARVTFVADPIDAGLMPESAAPYLSEGIAIAPEPLTRGVPATLSAQVSNPGDTPIVVEGTFAFAQQGIGLVFGPISTQQLTIPPKSTVRFSTPFTPPIEGHFCFRFEYSIVSAGGQAVLASGGGSAQRNASTRPGGPPKQLKQWGENGPTNNTAAAPPSPWSSWGGIIGGTRQVAQSYQGKGGPQVGPMAALQQTGSVDFRQVTVARTLTLPPLQPGGGISPQRATAHNAVTAALADVLVTMEATQLAWRRYEAAAAARDTTWASRQASAANYYGARLATAFTAAADRLDAYLALARSEGLGAYPISLAEVRAHQERLRTQGYTAEETAALRRLGLGDAAIAANLAADLAADPAQVAGDYLAHLAAVATEYRGFAGVLREQPLFPGAGEAPGLAAMGSNLARPGELRESIVIGNPFAMETTMELRVRPVDLPPDWMVAVSEPSLTLKPGEQRQVIVTITPGTAVQGTQPQVAVEGYAGGELVDGVGFTVVVPEQLPFDGRFHVALPLIRR